ncbi:HAMP domain-containing sensor histidine kinase [soil metagenome]
MSNNHFANNKVLKFNYHFLFLIALITLVFAIMLRYFFIEKKQNPQNYLQTVEERLNHELDHMTEDMNAVIRQITEGKELTITNLNAFSRYPYYIFNQGKLIYWSDYRFVPSYSSLAGNYKYRFLSYKKGQFIFKKLIVPGYRNIEIFVLLPIFINTEIDNNYLTSGFNKNIFSSSNFEIRVLPVIEDSMVLAERQHYLFSITFGPDYKLYNEPYQILILVLSSIAIILAFAHLLMWIRYLILKNKYQMGLLVLVSWLLLVRGLMLIFNYPFNLINLDLFNSIYYASSDFNPSLGDLLLNVLSLFLVVVYIFKFYDKFKAYKVLMKQSSYHKTLISVLLILLSFLALYFQFLVLRSIYHHSQLSIDITSSITFSSLKIVCLIIFIINAIIYFLLAHLICKIFLQIGHSSRLVNFYVFLAGTLLFITLSHVLDMDFMVFTFLNFIYFAVLYTLGLPRHLAKIRYISFIYLFMGALVCALVGAYSVYNFEQVQNLDNKQRFANQILIENDILAENLLFEAVQRIKNDIFIKSRFTGLFASRDIIKQKIKRHYLSNYFDKYDVQVHLFNSMGMSMDLNDSIWSYYDLKDQVGIEKYETEYPDLYFINDPGLTSTKTYFYFLELKRFGLTVGHILLDLRLKKIIPNTVYPELLIDKRFYQPNLNRNYSYAIFSEEQLVNSAGNFNYVRNFDPRHFEKEKLYEEGINRDSFHHYGVYSEDNRIIIISSPHELSRIIVSNFSFLFLIFIFAILILIIIYAIYFRIKKVNLNLATKIQLYLNSSFFLPLLVVSIATLSLISSSFRNDLNRQYFKKAENVTSNIVGPLDTYINNPSYLEELSNYLSQIARFSEADINLFNTNGKLIASSQPQIYNNDLLSEFINPRALSYIHEQNYSRIILEESVGTLTYKSAYVAIKSFETGNIIGIMSIPFFESKAELERQVIDVLTNIINIFTFIFIVLLLISYFASQLLTYPLMFITQKIKRTTLSKYNEPLEWKSDDEIGLLVGEYNRMLVNLEASKEALSKSEKESAWREMAKQVAHEIKNPLTPMKLILQHLKRIKNDKNPQNDGKIEKQINTLLHQVDTLNDIATSFSSFAQMPIPKNELFELSSVVRKAVNLHHNENEKLILNNFAGEVKVMGDENLMERIISNLIINGIQSVPKGRIPTIEISIKNKKSEKVLIEIKDNGIGIAENIKNKVFIPNFSTKYTGSGIGLAIAKRGIEHAGGTIWFETQEGEGTSFFIELPVVM